MRPAVARHLAGTTPRVTRPRPTVSLRFRLAIEPVHALMAPDRSMVIHTSSGSSSSLMHAMPSGISGHIRGNRRCHSHGPAPFRHPSSPEAPSLGRHYPASSVVRASPPPCRPSLPLTGFRLVRATPPTALPVLLPSPCSMRAAANTPAGPAGALVAHFPASGSLPQRTGGSAPAFQVSRPAQRSLALRPAWSLDHPRRPVPPKCFERCRYLHHPLRLLPAGATVCRAGFAPAERRCLSTAYRT